MTDDKALYTANEQNLDRLTRVLEQAGSAV